MKTISLPVAPSIVIKSLLTTCGNYKLDYSMAKMNCMVGSLTLRPAHIVKNEKGKVILNTCPWASNGCKAVCVLEKCGMSVYPMVKKCRDAKTDMLAHNPKEFIEMLDNDLSRIVQKAKNQAKKTKTKEKKIFIRLNTASDIEWEKVCPELIAKYPQISFYDYTKATHRFANIPANYNLVYSWNENSKASVARSILDSGNNVAIVFSTSYWQGKKGTLPKQFQIDGKMFNVVDGDEHDLRVKRLDGSGVIVGLRSKGGKGAREKGLASGFVVDENSSGI